MKKTILSLTALLMAGFASAQSYPKQPDRTVVNYVEYTKEAKAEPEAEVQPKEQAAIEASQTEEQTNDEAAAAQPETAVNSNTVSENRRNDKMRKE